MRPAVVMMAVYRETLDRLQARGWKRIDDPIGLTPRAKDLARAAPRIVLACRCPEHTSSAQAWRVSPRRYPWFEREGR